MTNKTFPNLWFQYDCFEWRYSPWPFWRGKWLIFISTCMINRKIMSYFCSNKSDNKHKKLKLIRKHLLFPLAVSLWNWFGWFFKEFVQNHQQQKGSNSSSNCVKWNLHVSIIEWNIVLFVSETWLNYSIGFN